MYIQSSHQSKNLLIIHTMVLTLTNTQDCQLLIFWNLTTFKTVSSWFLEPNNIQDCQLLIFGTYLSYTTVNTFMIPNDQTNFLISCLILKYVLFPRFVLGKVNRAMRNTRTRDDHCPSAWLTIGHLSRVTKGQGCRINMPSIVVTAPAFTY